MLILGLLLIIASGAVAVVLIAHNGEGSPQTVFSFGRDIADVTVMQAFVAGIVVALVFVLGIWMAVVGARHSREYRARYREARHAARAAARERDELAERVRQEEEYRAEQEADELAGVSGQRTQRLDQPFITNLDQHPK
jgi:uncharacterized membrane protein